jgi:hypothetical protein
MEDKKYDLYNNVVITPRLDDTYKLEKEFTYKDITVPKNYHTNGADIPRFLWIFWPPNRSVYIPAVIIHDYLCDKKEYKKADTYFKEILQVLNIGKFTIFMFYYSVRIYHELRYQS